MQDALELGEGCSGEVELTEPQSLDFGYRSCCGAPSVGIFRIAMNDLIHKEGREITSLLTMFKEFSQLRCRHIPALGLCEGVAYEFPAMQVKGCAHARVIPWPPLHGIREELAGWRVCHSPPGFEAFVDRWPASGLVIGFAKIQRFPLFLLLVIS